jgi:NADP-dependent 3-hydroxy acid dehydrogenase YdfG
MESKVIVITGASSGIGAAVAKLLGSQGHKLVLAARREAELKQVAAEAGANAVAVVTDVTNRQEVDHLCAEALNTFGHVDVWINNAGRGIGRKVMDLTDEDLDAMISLNLKSALYGMQTIIPHFQARGKGHLINVSSFLTKVPFATIRSAYIAAKCALNALTAALRLDLKAAYPDIFISTVLPGVVLTDFHRNALHGTPQFAPGRMIQPQSAAEVATAIAELIENPRAEWYTNPAQIEVARQYNLDMETFERNLIAASTPVTP